MQSPAHRPRGHCLVAIFAMLIAGAFAPAASAADAGTIRLARGAESNFDRYTKSPTPEQQSFIRSRFWRMRVYAPYFDSRVSWYRDGWAYQDAYALYPSGAAASEHPDWILRDAAGNKLWIQFACGGGKCTQYAADIGNPAFRKWWIESARTKLKAGYRGLWIDDVNMAQRISDGYGKYTKPIDPRTGEVMSEATWQRYMADFMVQVRAAFPTHEMVHNALWTVGDGNADLRRQLAAADYINLERGFNDSGIVGGTGKFGWQTMANFIERRHTAGTAVVLDGRVDSNAARLYNLANYFLLNSGSDVVANDPGTLPDRFWKGFYVNLGAAAGPRYRSGNVWRRDFAGGTALVNEPGAPTRTVSLGSGYRDIDGVRRTSVTLGPASGAVLLRDGTPTATTVSAAPAPAATPVQAGPAPVTQPASGPKRRVATWLRVTGVRVHGSVRRATRGKVRIVVQRRRAHRWTMVRRVHAKVRGSGRYNRTLAPLARGRYRVRARYLGTATTMPSLSRYHRFRVRR